KTGDLIVDSGVELTPEALAALASAGLGSVTVSARPRVLVLSTGDELVEPGSALSRGQIPDSNAILISFLAKDSGASVATGHAGDGPGELAEALAGHEGKLDLIVLTGGVSVGAHDPVKALFEGKGEVRFDRVSMQPGKPQAFGRLGEDGPL